MSGEIEAKPWPVELRLKSEERVLPRPKDATGSSLTQVPDRRRNLTQN